MPESPAVRAWATAAIIARLSTDARVHQCVVCGGMLSVPIRLLWRFGLTDGARCPYVESDPEGHALLQTTTAILINVATLDELLLITALCESLLPAVVRLRSSLYRNFVFDSFCSNVDAQPQLGCVGVHVLR